MKKGFLYLLVIVVLLIISAFIFLPKSIHYTKTEKINCSINSINRFVLNENQWQEWWPGSIEHTDSAKNIFIYKGYKYTISKLEYNKINIQAEATNLIINTSIIFVQLSGDSTFSQWSYSLSSTLNPVSRLQLYTRSKKIDNNISDIMLTMKTFLENPEKVYKLNINQIKVKDTLLVTTKFSSNTYPSTSKVYEVIGSIKKYIADNNALETNFPMLNVWTDSGLYHTTIAIPVNKRIIENNLYSIKRMVPGKILVAEIKGGENTVKDRIRLMEIFMTDNHLSSPAIPFESLITNRMQEPDTSKWVTKIYYPVF